MRLLLIEDNPELARATVERLQLDGHAVDHAKDLSSAHDLVAVTLYDLVLLDIMLPDGDGRSFLKELRRGDDAIPVIAVTARSQVADRVGLLDLGADDYITKPFDFSELQARIRAVLRRRGGAASNIASIGDLKFDRLAGTLSGKSGEIELRNKELRLLEVFTDSPNVIFGKPQLVDHLFSFSDDVSENAIEVYVGRLRKHLEGSTVSIKTVRGVGYKLEVENG